MTSKLAFLVLLVFFFSSCIHTKIEEEPCKRNGIILTDGGFGEDKIIVFTNTSRSKYIEVTIKTKAIDGTFKTGSIKLKPGEIYRGYYDCSAKPTIVGEREIVGE
jgi:hypothetical protein